MVQWIFPRLEKILPHVAHRFFLTIFFSPLNYPIPHKERLIEKEAERFYVKVKKMKIRCYAWGEGPVVMLVHGWAGRATQFRKFIPVLLGEGFRVVGFDGPAHGHSDGRSTNIMEFADALKKVCEATGGPVGILAHSFGGGAVLYAAMHGLPVRKLVNIASPTIGDEIINTYLKTINASAETGRYFRTYIERTTGKPFDEFTSLYFIQHIRQEIDLLLVHDEDDTEVSISHALELIRRYPAARLIATRGLGHTRILKDDQVIKRCVSFLKS